VIAVDRDREIVDAARDKVTLAVRFDSTDEKALRLHGVDQVQAAVVGIGADFESSVLTVSTLKSLELPRIVCRAESAQRAEILSQVGADVIVNPEAETAERWANRLMLPDLKDYVELGEGHSLIQIRTPPDFQQRSPGELQLRQDYHVNLVAIKRLAQDAEEPGRKAGAYEIIVPRHDTIMLPDDILILVGTNESLGALTHR